MATDPGESRRAFQPTRCISWLVSAWNMNLLPDLRFLNPASYGQFDGHSPLGDSREPGGTSKAAASLCSALSVRFCLPFSTVLI
jgi:hypothetical protein